MCHEIMSTWSTPWGLYFMPHRVLHLVNLELTFYPRYISTQDNYMAEKNKTSETKPTIASEIP